MNLNDINSGDPAQPQGKFFLNPICNNLSCSSLSAQSFKVNKLIGAGNSRIITVTGSTSLTLSTSDLISGIIGLIVSPASGVVNVVFTIPTAAVLDAALSSFTPPFYFQTNISAVFNVAVTQGNIIFSIAGTSITPYDSSNPMSFTAYVNTAPVTNQNRWQTTLTFYRSISGWSLYG